MQAIRTIAILLATVSFLGAAQPDARLSNLASWEATLAAREQRANLLRDEIKALDSRIESRGDSLLGALRTIGDSKDSRTRVARMKEETVAALRRNIRYYQNKRATMTEELRRPTLNLTEEQKRRIVAAFDRRIEKRVGQILDVLKSLPTHKDYERYRVEGSTWFGTTYAVNEDYLQNQHLNSITTRLRREVEEGLRKSIDRLDRNNRTLRAQMNTEPYSAYPKGPTEEIAKNDALIAERRRQIDVALSFVGTPTLPIGRKEAIDFDRSRTIAISELRRDFYTLFARYNTLIPELCAINSLRAAIAAAKPQPPRETPQSSPGNH